MKEIKYRAWDKREEEMCEVISIDFENKLVRVSCIDRSTVYMDSTHPMTNRLYKFDRVELLEYTGLKDKNGVEIYEGDLCTDNEDPKKVIEILWSDNHQWGCKIVKTDYVLSRNQTFPLWNWDRCERNGSRQLEIIGNIYENPELLSE